MKGISKLCQDDVLIYGGERDDIICRWMPMKDFDFMSQDIAVGARVAKFLSLFSPFYVIRVADICSRKKVYTGKDCDKYRATSSIAV